MFDKIKTITFLTTCNKTIEGCQNPKNRHKLIEVKLKIPKKIQHIIDNYKVVKYIEELTGLFVLEVLKINNKKLK